MTAAGLTFADVTVCYDDAPAVHHLDARLPHGCLAALVGRNGAGKSTLLRAALGWQPTTTGAIVIGHTATCDHPDRIHYLPQRSSVDWDFPISVREVAAMGRYHRLGAFAAFADDDQARVDAALAEMDLVALQQRQINALSGGQQQRALLARALASGADVFLLDEPFAGLDPAAAVDLATRLRAWADQGRIVLAAVHDVALVRAHFTHALLLNTHLVAAGPVAEVMSEANLTQAFQRPDAKRTA